MNPDLLSANVSLAFMAVVAVAGLAHLSQLAGGSRLQHAIYAATAAGLFYLFGGKALGWTFIPREALLVVYGALFLIVAALPVVRPRAIDGIPWGGLLIELAAMAYIFAPLAFWKPPVSALLFIYFLLELFSWMKGREPAIADSGEKDHRPPLFPPKRVRGVREFAAAAAAAALVYVFAMGTGRAPVAPAPEEQATTEQPAETAASSEPADSQAVEAAEDKAEQSKPAEAAEAVQPAAATPQMKPQPVDVYAAKAGDTLKSLARKLYGKTNKLAALTAANPGVKATVKLKPGQIIRLPEPPTAQP